MRRRQIWAARAAEATQTAQSARSLTHSTVGVRTVEYPGKPEIFRFTDEALDAAEKPLPRGTCPNCGKHIGKGLYFHRKNCNV